MDYQTEVSKTLSAFEYGDEVLEIRDYSWVTYFFNMTTKEWKNRRGGFQGNHKVELPEEKVPAHIRDAVIMWQETEGKEHVSS